MKYSQTLRRKPFRDWRHSFVFSCSVCTAAALLWRWPAVAGETRFHVRSICTRVWAVDGTIKSELDSRELCPGNCRPRQRRWTCAEKAGVTDRRRTNGDWWPGVDAERTLSLGPIIPSKRGRTYRAIHVREAYSVRVVRARARLRVVGFAPDLLDLGGNKRSVQDSKTDLTLPRDGGRP